MKNFTFYSPTEVIFGKDTELQVADEIRKHGGTRVLTVYGGGSVVKSGLLERVEKSLEKAGLPFTSIGGVSPNPRLSLARDGVKKAVEFGADFILGIGGGSVLDTAKAIAHGAANPETDIWLFWKKTAVVTKSSPVGAILTISAAGSETSDSAVLTNGDTGEKRGLNTPFNRPRFAIMNPELTYTLPPFQLSCGIVDIMMHTMDRYFTLTEGNELTDEFAEALLRVVIKNGTKAMENPHDYDAMSELMWCGSLSHNGLTGLGAVIDFAPHQLGHELSGKFDVAHGASLSTIWGSWARYCYQTKPERFVRFAEKVWGISGGSAEEVANRAIDTTVAFFASLHMPTCFTELGIGMQSEEVLGQMADSCMFFGKRKIGGFRVLDRDDAFRIYQMANH
ncbi:iron-containing alcohol dehydrogenase [Caproiciproducens faecalis]|uniref:Iron-containing alcohol dehydrogenase n=1 Tax=Caproiciproducens faecalis TaxID=2820301 RepID=A0ABS7DJ44_9FIRM|nr:iron-containing alcohol dehydrogenase [Caproiciproducens faecalis]MBW7571315.1 iron-containing alcohol dehydrogenase [Caproiciproducens faecalis]